MREGLNFDDVLIEPQHSYVTSRKEVNLETFFEFDNGVGIEFVPIFASNMHNIGTVKVASVLTRYGLPTVLEKSVVDEEQLLTVPSFGLELRHQLNILDNVTTQIICLDIANGYLEPFIQLIETVKEKYPHLVIIAGNVATVEGVNNLFSAGADVVKVGIGPGLACSTRMQTGVGIPQLTAIQEASNIASVYRKFKNKKKYVMADGGCKTPGDIAKAFVAGADMVMIGGMLAGHEETGTHFYGSSSWRAMEDNGIKKEDVSYRSSEGLELDVEFRGRLQDTIENILGGLRSTCTYLNARHLSEIVGKNTFIRTSRIK